MKDRAPKYPGRVRLIPVAGQENTFDMTRADEATQDGTPLNTATLLKQQTASLFGLGADAVPDDVFSMLSRFHAGLGNEYVWEKRDTANQLVGYVNTSDPHAYPPAVDDGFAYNGL